MTSRRNKLNQHKSQLEEEIMLLNKSIEEEILIQQNEIEEIELLNEKVKKKKRENSFLF